jgi:aminoglycoside 3-N-acetyltransferase
MITFRQLVSALRDLGIDRSRPVIAHASLSAFGEVQGGAETLLGALMYCLDTLIMPAFTYQTMVVPEIGPAENGLAYGSYRDANLMAQFFHPNMPVDRLMGVLPEALRRSSKSSRSSHPILSFVGMNAQSYLASQTLTEPLQPIGLLMEAQGWVLLLSVDHTVNTSLHFAERLAGRKQFMRWALTSEGIVECPQFPGCSDGFNQIAPALAQVTRKMQIGPGWVQAIPLVDLISTARAIVEADPLALLCENSYCERCPVIRDQVAASAAQFPNFPP